MALTTAGTVLAWGANSNGQLGDGTGTTRLSPVPVALPPSTVITAISAGPAAARDTCPGRRGQAQEIS